MQRGSSDFVSVKPQGTFGDRKNDGYDRKLGSYYQVFAPEDLTLKAQKAVEKLKDDFSGLMEYWNTITPVSEFHFVLNDKYKGSFPTIESDLADIKKDHELRECGSFLAKHLEERLFVLNDDQIVAVVGFILDPSNIQLLDYSILSEVIFHIMQYKGELEPTLLLSAPNFDEKIKFNGLSIHTANLLQAGAYQVGSLENYFSLNSNFAKQELRDTLNGIYLNSLTKHFDTSTGMNASDLRFFDILNTAAPNQTQAVQNATLILMAYFFEACDIFEDPKSGDGVDATSGQTH
jgi:hypothetical protein